MKKRHHVKNAWWVSPYADLPELRKGTTPGSVQLYDYTLRAWGRGYGMIYDATEVARMVDKLATIGVERIELGLPDEESLSVGDVRNVVEAYPDILFSTRLHGGKKDVQAAAECGIKQVLISIPLGYPQIKYRLGWTWEASLEKMLEATEYARESDLQVIAAPGDIARSTPRIWIAT